ncbi:MAG TPA: TIGR00303 family protein [Oscillatoriaceae cyanobacterium M33_DOE_052]|uniref:UPF0284 protein ENR15_14185 n=1 Tax=Planktothricoides sp. SpSt-374 TaxID=2282167 RepID=A0A7C3ZI37_9CYAN|nr:TIGR00303 family protein [Oscillatoriaceae cyanobacterium M33_DOE_052]
MIEVYAQREAGQRWLERYRGCRPVFACVLGFTDTALIPGISAAGATPADRRYTAIADAEFLALGGVTPARHPLPPLTAGASPVLISRAVLEGCHIPHYLFNAGLPQPPTVPTVDLGGIPARCLTTGAAMDLETVRHLLAIGLLWGDLLAKDSNSYAILAECVVGGTTTALAVSLGLGIPAAGKVNSSHPQCNHQQKWEVVQTGLQRAKLVGVPPDPLLVVAAVGDPMQPVVAGMTISASRKGGVLLAGGTQMLAVYALTRAISRAYDLFWCPEQVVVGTTRWVAADPTGDTVGLAQSVGSVPLLATNLSFAASEYPQLRAYEQGYVKEGVGAGGAAIAAHLYSGWNQSQLLAAVESMLRRR